MTLDPELPGGFQDADFEMRELEAAGRYHERMRKAGKCTHTWVQGPLGEAPKQLWDKRVPADAKPHQYFCFHCLQLIDGDPFAGGR